MKLNRIILPAMAMALTLAACEDNKMEWGTPDGHGQADLSDIPLSLTEKIANYKSIKEYAAEYIPNMTVGLGIGADYYINNGTVKQLADANFNTFTTGNAMKHDAVVGNKGELNFATIDAFVNAIPADAKMYGHCFLWHTQQKQMYLKSLITPEVVIEDTGGDDVCENVITNSGFESGTDGWTGLWGKYTYAVEAPGKDSDNAIHFTMTGETAANYDCQLFWPLASPLEDGVTYAFSADIKSDMDIAVQFIGQNASYAGIYKDSYTAPADWLHVTGEFTYNAASETTDIIRVGFQFGGTPGSNVWIDNLKFGVKKVEKMKNVITNPSFADGTNGWTGLWGKYTYGVEAPGRTDDTAIRFTMTDETAANYDSQLFWALDTPLEVGATYAFSFYTKSDMNIAVQAIGQNASYSGIYKDSFTALNDWTLCEGEFTYNASDPADIVRFGVQFGGTPGSTIWIDDFKFGLKNEEAQPKAKNLARAAGGVTYIYKTPEEKRTALLGAMETWIKGMAEHMGDRMIGWDVINEPIDDSTKGVRGINGVFGSEDADGNPDTAPVEQDGLNLNWASNHFYWGYYLGMEYATKAFEYARKHCRPETKLFVNDYNLEVSPAKLDALINFVKYIDEHNETNAPIVDGIGTQMHAVAADLTREKIDEMFKKLAATGKIIRITELDVRHTYEPTANPSAEQLMKQADVYRWIIESYKENVPATQQSGFTIWSLSDHADEHTGWFTGDTPNLFDANYARKPAYKGVCDGIAGRDISEDFTGDDWKAAYEVKEEETPADQ